jgi:hypothetical protein
MGQQHSPLRSAVCNRSATRGGVPPVSEAVIGFLGVVIGGLITGFVSLFQVQHVTKREREARRALREQERKDRRDAFQRESLLALQDAVEDVRQFGFHEYERKWAIWKRDDVWEAHAVGDPLPKDWSDADARVAKLWARVFDSELESLIADFQLAAGEAIAAEDQTKAFDEANRVSRLAYEINRRDQ